MSKIQLGGTTTWVKDHLVEEPGRWVGLGDWVEFKSDIEQHGQIIEIRGTELVLENKNGFPGDYLRYATTTVMPAGDCW